MRQLRFLTLWLTLGWVLVGLVVYFSLIPSPPEPLSFPAGDKLIHLSIYAGMMLWFGFIYFPGRAYRNLGVAFIMMGLILELIQGLIDYRSMEYLDMLANSIGVSLGWLLARTRLASTLTQLESGLGT